MKFNLKYLFIASLIALLPIMTKSMQNPGALFETDYRKEGFGTIEDLEKILLLKIGIDPGYEVAQHVMDRIYAGIVKIFIEKVKAIEIAVPTIDTTYVPGEIICISTNNASEDDTTINVILSATAKVSSTVQFTEIFSSLGNHQKQGILYSICEPIQKRQFYFEGKEITQYDLNRYIEWAYVR